jgi:hypothetical protein
MAKKKKKACRLLKVRVCKECEKEFETYISEKYCCPVCRIKYKARRDSK